MTFTSCRTWNTAAALLVVTVYTTFANASPRVSATAPMESIDEGGVLAVHCRVWNLQPNQEVTILRKLRDDKVERLSLRDGLVSGTPDRVFLAVRQLEDASNVYFLSIMDVTRQDEGEYICYIVSNLDGFTQVATDSVQVDIFYFASDLYPNCQSDSPAEMIEEGSLVNFNCSSEVSNPPVSMTWTQTGKDTTIQTLEEIHGNQKFSSMTMRVEVQDHGSVFLCTVSSDLFPGESRTCHIGPLGVIRLADGDRTFVPTNNMGKTPQRDDTKLTVTAEAAVTKYSSGDENWRVNCRQSCSSSLSSSAFFWIIATVVSVIFAVVFCIIGITLLVRFCRTTNNIRTTTSSKTAAKYTAARLVSESEIYSELENNRRRLDSKFYMTLVKQDDVEKNRFIPDKHCGGQPTINQKLNSRSFNT